jgi:hypothetical protein
MNKRVRRSMVTNLTTHQRKTSMDYIYIYKRPKEGIHLNFHHKDILALL